MIAAFLLSLFGFILINIPISFSLVLTTLVLMLFTTGIEPQIITQSVLRGIDNFPLLAIPFFMLAGEIMSVGGISYRIVIFSRALVGHISGGLGYVLVVAGMLLSGISGSAVADTSALGSVLLPVMKKEGYDVKHSTALVTAAGTNGPIIPPSIPMILYGVTAGVSVVKLFLGGIVPGILVAIGLGTVWFLHARKANYGADRRATMREVLSRGKEAFWALVLPVIIMGVIISGIATPTEAAVIAVVASFIIAKYVYKELKFSDMTEILVMSGKSTAVVMLVCGTAMAAAYLMTTAQIPVLLSNLLVSLAGGNVLMLMFWINILLLVVGCVMDLTPALLILAPILLPLVESYGLDPVYFGVVMIVNLCIGLITPPVGTVLYVGCGLSKLSIYELTRPVLPYIVMLTIVLFLITYIPGLIMWIPSFVK